MQSQARSRYGHGVMRLGALALTACGLLAGCGGSSGARSAGRRRSSSAAGSWITSVTARSASTAPPPFRIRRPPLWNELPLEQGTLTDITETSGFCLPNDLSFNLDKDGVTLAIANPDPFTGMAPICAFQVSATQFVEIDFTTFTFTF